MDISFAADLNDGRRLSPIGRIKAATRWRAAGDATASERQAAIEALKREAADYGADALVDVRFEVDGVKGVDIEGVPLERVVVTGVAVRFSEAA